uniref:TATA-box binding protein n=1 Tax=Panagrolaimus sp. PS1159 TaxID=55785 RepID=A0AC35F7V3_9BILA
MVPSSQSQFGGMDSAFQQLSQLLYLQSLASPSAIKSPMINPQLGQMPMTPKMPSMTQ